MLYTIGRKSKTPYPDLRIVWVKGPKHLPKAQGKFQNGRVYRAPEAQTELWEISNLNSEDIWAMTNQMYD